jgi:nitrogen-specific signal transduction histidine kinase/ActR/RegA family two-component response regulator
MLCEDITEEKSLQNQLQQAQKMESIGSLAGGIAHDFNNILSSIIGFTELALDDVEKGTILEDSLQEVYTAGKRAKDLVKQILAFARQSDEEFKPIHPSSIVREVLKLIRPSIPTSIEIRQNIKSDSLIMGNATQVHQILMNLCTNAAYAMEADGGILDISMKDVMIDGITETEKPGNYIEITVSDTGVGIAPDILDKIFEPYFTTKGPGEGTGMGLAMVHGIVESYGGRITVDSKPGQGTRFTICLPVIRERQKHSQYETEALPSGKERILFVDDEAPIARMGSQMLERLGYSVTTRTSSVEALELFRLKPDDFDLVITDMTMPNMTGDKFAAALIEIRPEIPVILCTGYSKQLSAERAAEAGIKAYAMKPLARNILAETVRKVLDEAKSSPQQ